MSYMPLADVISGNYLSTPLAASVASSSFKHIDGVLQRAGLEFDALRVASHNDPLRMRTTAVRPGGRVGVPKRGTPARSSSGAAPRPYERYPTAASRTAPKRGSTRKITAYKKRRPPIGRDGELLCHALYDLEVKVCGGASTSIKAHAPERQCPREGQRGRRRGERAREPEGTTNNTCRRLRRPLHGLVRKERDL